MTQPYAASDIWESQAFDLTPELAALIEAFAA